MKLLSSLFLATGLLLPINSDIYRNTLVRERQEINANVYKVIDFDVEAGEGEKALTTVNNSYITFSRWRNQATLTIAPIHKYDMYIKKHDSTTLKFGVILNEKPDSNQVRFMLIGWQQYDFLYQNESTMTDDVKYSYAIYHKTLKNHALGGINYRTGKFGHIYRPKFIDSKGVKVWADLNIKDGIYTITIPQKFLDTATYPIKANDTFGYTSIGASSAVEGWGWPDCYPSETDPASDGSMTSMSVYGRTNGGTPRFDAALYDSDGASGVPGTRLAYINSGGTTFSGSNAWVSTAITYGSLSASHDYWLGFKTDDSSSGSTLFYDAGAVRNYYINATNWPTPYGGSQDSLRAYSIYVTYTASAGSTRRIIIN